MPPGFFVCYRRESAGYALSLSRALADRHGRERVFQDTGSIALAQDWRAAVTAALGRSTHVLVLVGPHWMEGVDEDGRRDGWLDPVVFEVEEAFRLGRTVVPVLLDGVRMPAAHRLPHALRRLPDLHAAHVRHETAESDIALLVDRLPPPPYRVGSSVPAVDRPPPPPSRSGAGGLVGVVVLLGVLGSLFWLGSTAWEWFSGGASATGSVPTSSPVTVPAAGPTAAPQPGPATPLNRPDQDFGTPSDPDPAPGPGTGTGSGTGGSGTGSGSGGTGSGSGFGSGQNNGPTSRADPVLRLAPDSGPPGSTVTATATGFPPGATVRFIFHASPLRDAVADGDGRVSVSLTVPDRSFVGNTYEVTVQQEQSTVYDSALFTVTG